MPRPSKVEILPQTPAFDIIVPPAGESIKQNYIIFFYK